MVNGRDTCRTGSNAPTRFPDIAPPGGAEPGSAIISAVVDADTITLDSAAGFTTGSPIVIDSPLETLRYINAIIGNTIDLNAPMAVVAGRVGDPVAQVSFAQSLRDLNNDGFLDISDVPLLTAVAGSQGGNPANDGVGDSGVPGYQGRYDFNNDGFVDISDIIAMVVIFGAACGPT